MTMLSKAVRTYRRSGVRGVLSKALTPKTSETPGHPLPMEWTNYMEWLCKAIPGWLDRGNVHCFNHAIANLPSDVPIVEIGTFSGLSTMMLSHLKQIHGKRNKIITCDPWTLNADHCGEMKPVSFVDYFMFVRETFVRSARTFCRDDMPHGIENYSDRFFEEWASGVTRRDVTGRLIDLGGPISFAYIDGAHDYPIVKRDFENVDRYLERGGFILFDDSAEDLQWTVYPLMADVEATKRYQLLAKHPHYFWRKVH